MGLPLLTVPSVTQNARVKSFALGGDESPRMPPGNGKRSGSSNDELIEQAYRQIFFHAFKVDRDPALESQLRNGQISVRDFVRSLLLSAKFRNDFYRCNSNYRMVDQIVGRVLGRQVHGQPERIALSILIAQKGLTGLVDHLLDTPEYLQAFGTDAVPHQRSRVLSGRPQGEIPFNQQAPRYDSYWREITAKRAPAGRAGGWASGSAVAMPRPTWLADAPSPLARKIWQGLVTAGGFGITGLLLYIAASMLSTAGAS
ncbi:MULTISPECIES: phycobilisome rod-core linker polypeptide [unclassified Cyanobium]|uniref:phycobilisome rod-core linker polypeptide n=1 Tax=unclassified Cyanobium TaxID=2627006 RepID=UPI0020CF5939|nr:MULTISPECIES: phycobilisome rod-core linker polypeptide [unclassified Cyanobium]MCP9835066.1 phycobilisome rod-core linker polypeptide [Cyanobium sp. La Preciosa 7G6]MCP9937829.1 phycobilisome rod-core linker polypeptide [Cyanobium sp. Aljojuca 7A6]